MTGSWRRRLRGIWTLPCSACPCAYSGRRWTVRQRTASTCRRTTWRWSGRNRGGGGSGVFTRDRVCCRSMTVSISQRWRKGNLRNGGEATESNEIRARRRLAVETREQGDVLAQGRSLHGGHDVAVRGDATVKATLSNGRWEVRVLVLRGGVGPRDRIGG